MKERSQGFYRSAFTPWDIGRQRWNMPRPDHILHAKQFLGHKRLENTEVYTRPADFATEDYTARWPKTSKGKDELVE